ncbi:MAG: helix-turn-helix domain-containing protein [Treponema sp.]|nr:helix-turn-helix domain-containing protein [Treponema sp.]
MNFWEKVDSELKFLGKTRKELASYVNIDVANISFGIKRNSIPYADTAIRVSQFLGVSLEHLLGMEEKSIQTEENSKILEIENSLKHFSQNDLDVILTVVKALNEKYTI